MYRGIYMCIHL